MMRGAASRKMEQNVCDTHISAPGSEKKYSTGCAASNCDQMLAIGEDK